MRDAVKPCIRPQPLITNTRRQAHRSPHASALTVGSRRGRDSLGRRGTRPVRLGARLLPGRVGRGPGQRVARRRQVRRSASRSMQSRLAIRRRAVRAGLAARRARPSGQPLRPSRRRPAAWRRRALEPAGRAGDVGPGSQPMAASSSTPSALTSERNWSSPGARTARRPPNSRTSATTYVSPASASAPPAWRRRRSFRLPGSDRPGRTPATSGIKASTCASTRGDTAQAGLHPTLC